MSAKVGFVGVGAMGSAIASRLVDRYDLWVSDRNPDAAKDLIERGAHFATAAEVATGAKFVFTCLPGPTQVEELLFGEDHLASVLEPDSVLIDTSSSTPDTDARVVAGLGVGVSFVDSPIGGGVRRAREGTATLMVGADADVFATVAPVLQAVTSTVYHVGPVGAGHAMKLVNNLLNSCNRYAALEAIRLGQICGIPQDTVVDVLNHSTGRNYTTEYSFTQLTRGDTWLPQGFTLELMLKDIRLANELADSKSHSTPIGHLVEQMTEQAIERFGQDADQSTLMERWYAPGR